MITPLDVLSAGLVLLFVALPLLTHARTSRRAHVVPALPDRDADLRQDWQTPARRLRLATMNCPAAKQGDWKHRSPLQTSSACGDRQRSPAAVTGESAATSRIIRFATRQGGR